MNLEPTTDSKHEPGTYTVPTLRPVSDVIAFPSDAPTDIDPQYHLCPVCGVWDVDCECGS